MNATKPETSRRDLRTCGVPIAFLASTSARPASEDQILRVECSSLVGHQKEALVFDGTSGLTWRMASDEGLYLGGTDCAPAPLMYWGAGFAADVGHRFLGCAEAEGISLGRFDVRVESRYEVSGSFVDGSARGRTIDVAVRLIVEKASASKETLERLGASALKASPGLAAHSNQLTGTFALFANGRKHAVGGLTPCTGLDEKDPYLSHTSPPSPVQRPAELEIVRKISEAGGVVRPLPPSSRARQFSIVAQARIDPDDRLAHCTTELTRTPASLFSFVADEAGRVAPSGLAMMSAGVAFCFSTQIRRYVEARGLGVSELRLVQNNAYRAGPGRSDCSAFETQVFLNGRDSADAMEALLVAGVQTCFLHATLEGQHEPSIAVDVAGVTAPEEPVGVTGSI